MGWHKACLVGQCEPVLSSLLDNGKMVGRPVQSPLDAYVILATDLNEFSAISYYTQSYIQCNLFFLFSLVRLISQKVKSTLDHKYILIFWFPGKTCRRNWETEIWTGSNEIEGWFFNWTHIVKVIFNDKSFLPLNWKRTQT